jgi:indole-3-glycerol phosphate synthase
VQYQNYVLDENHVAEARAAGAAAVTLYSSVLAAPLLRRTVSVTQRWRMASVVQVENPEQMEYAQTLSPHVMAVGSISRLDTDDDLALLSDVRAMIPPFTHVMLSDCLCRLEHVHAALDLGVDALILDETLLNDPDAMAEIHSRIARVAV